MFFALRGGGESRGLKFEQLTVKVLSNGMKYLEYCEMGFKITLVVDSIKKLAIK